MYPAIMNAFQLFQLGRKLAKLGAQAMPGTEMQQVGASVRTILSDVSQHPGSSISEITARTELPQSQVSACVAQLRESGVVETSTDPRDRRRTIVHPAPEALQRRRERHFAAIDAVLAEAIGTGNPADVERARAALEVLTELLLHRGKPARPSE